MLYREDKGGLIAIGQPAHAWLAGQIARAWGNEQFGYFSPYEEVCLAAAQHDIAHAVWETAPALNPHTGRPYSFLDTPQPMRLSIISSASSLEIPQSRYAALLVSMHFTSLYEDFDKPRLAQEPNQDWQAFSDHEYALQQELLNGLRQDPYYSTYAKPEIIARNQKLIRAWDALSLLLCFGRSQPRTIAQVPASTAFTTLTLTPQSEDTTRMTLNPWPFEKKSVTFICEGRRLEQTFTDQDKMRQALTQAPWITLRFQLRPEDA
ncbi:DUF3891 family protein [Ktedonosporobacter rubrisoli]|uniref:DUF3891 family protein n=1 Tax=Ktedonosporobacter rubrisoli TaxID=2509675 RepID=A0A4P6K2C0_KTERU|nr:DUF3891 family protein [Ktedonosporobacter rubrisoli]QBD82042.1 DUF3891 family protein [Ktedonosporobacter rubrisoli]